MRTQTTPRLFARMLRQLRRWGKKILSTTSAPRGRKEAIMATFEKFAPGALGDWKRVRSALGAFTTILVLAGLSACGGGGGGGDTPPAQPPVVQPPGATPSGVVTPKAPCFTAQGSVCTQPGAVTVTLANVKASDQPVLQIGEGSGAVTVPVPMTGASTVDVPVSGIPLGDRKIVLRTSAATLDNTGKVFQSKCAPGSLEDPDMTPLACRKVAVVKDLVLAIGGLYGHFYVVDRTKPGVFVPVANATGYGLLLKGGLAKAGVEFDRFCRINVTSFYDGQRFGDKPVSMLIDVTDKDNPKTTVVPGAPPANPLDYDFISQYNPATPDWGTSATLSDGSTYWTPNGMTESQSRLYYRPNGATSGTLIAEMSPGQPDLMRPLTCPHSTTQ